MAEPLTRRQLAVRDFIAEYLHAHRMAPTYQEICRGVGVRSLATVARHLKTLDRKGHLVKGPSNQKRSFVLLGDVCPTCGQARCLSTRETV